MRLLRCIFVGLLTAPLARAAPVQTGIILPLSGAAQESGEAYQRGFQAAQEIWKLSPAPWQFFDDKSDAVVAAQTVEKAAKGGFKIWISEGLAPADIAMLKILRNKKGMLVSLGETKAASADASSLITVGARREDVSRSLAAFARKQLQLKRVALVWSLADGEARLATEDFKKAFTKLGGKVVSEFAYAEDNRDFTKWAAQLRKDRIDGVWAPLSLDVAVESIGLARAQLPGLPFFGREAWFSAPDFFKKLGAQAMGHYAASLFATDDPGLVNNPFVDGYRKLHKKDPDARAALAYDLAQAWVATGSDSAKLIGYKEAWVKSVTGVKGWNARDRRPTRDYAILESQSERATFKTRIFP